MSRPLEDAVRGYIERGRARFHMPGHKGADRESLFSALLPWDITEVDGADSLFDADGAIRALEREFEEIYGTERTLLCTGGATLCIQTMLALACGAGNTLVMGRNLHRSAVNAAALLDITPIWVYPDHSAGGWFSGRYDPQAVETALAENPGAAGVYITSPDYFGVISDIKGIAEVCDKYGVPLLVDNAHGAHLKFLPEGRGVSHPIECGAALCCDSLHKTLPALTGGALLHIGRAADAADTASATRYAADAKRMMAVFGSTSPSYPIMLSCERAAGYAKSEARGDFDEVARRLDELRELAVGLGFSSPLGVCDPAKLSVAFAPLGLDAEGFGCLLREGGVEPEYISRTACVFMAAGFNSPDDYSRLETALRSSVVANAGDSAPVAVANNAAPALPHLKCAVSVREAVFSLREQVSVERCAGRIAAADASPCPPGIPVVMPGELIDRETAQTLKKMGIISVSVVAR